jgi:hypothetical protein
MRGILSGKWAPFLAVALVMVCAPACRAGSSPKPDKHAQKIEKKLSKYKSGTLLHLAFSDNSECTGTVNALSDTSFTFNNSDTNAKETHNYSDVSSVEKGTEYIGAGSTPKHRGHIF